MMNQPPPDPLSDVLPHDISIEQELLGALLIRNIDFDLVCALQPEHFFDRVHQVLFGEIKRKIARGDPATPLTVRRVLPRTCDIAGLSAEKYLARLAAAAAIPSFVPHYADQIVQYAAAREHVINARDLARACTDGTPIDEALSVFRNNLEVISNGCLEHGQRDTSASHADVLDAGIDRMTAAVNDDQSVGVIPTSLAELDEVIGGLRRGNLVVIAGRPGMGKSTFMVSGSRQIAERKYGVGILSMEMDQPSIGLRLMTDHLFPSAPIAYSAADSGRINDRDQETLINAKYEIQSLPIEYDFARRMTVAGIRAAARRMASKLRKKGVSLDVLMIDYLKFIQASDRYASQRHYEIGEITAALRQLAMELNVCIVLLCQLNREVEKSDDKRPRLDHLRESGDIEQDADVVILLYREAYYLHLAAKDPAKKADAETRLSQVEFELELIIAKHRMGPTAPVRVFCDVRTSSVRSPGPAGI